MSDQLNRNNDNDLEEEENEEEEEIEVINHGNEEDGQEFSVAFDIQINEGSFILLVGKTLEKKLILRLVEKEDETKPFYQNEFSLEELKEINSYFDIFDNEDDAINNVIKHLNESEKELELIDDNNIKISIIIKEEKIDTKIDFILIKTSYVIEEEEEIQKDTNTNENNINNNKNNEDEIVNLEEINDEGIEEVENDNDNENEKGVEEHIDEANLEYSEENLEKSEKNYKNSNEKVSNTKKNINMEEINKNLDLLNNSPNKDISKNIKKDNGLHTIIEEANENVVLSVESNEPIIEQNKEKIILNQNKKNDEKEQIIPKKENNLENLENSGISKVIEELKNNLDSLGGAMNLIEDGEEDEQEQNTNGNEFNKNMSDELILFKHEIMKTIEALSENFNSQFQKQNNYFKEMEKNIKEQNDKKIKELKNEINKKDNQINEINNMLYENNEKIKNMEKNINKANEEIKKLNEELKYKTNKELNSSFKKQNKNSINNIDIERIENELNSKLKEIEKNIFELKNDYNKNNKSNDNINIKTFLERINNIDNRLKKNEDNTLNNNNLINESMNSVDNKIKSFETKIKNIEGIKKGDKDKKILLDKIFNLENKSKNLESKINDFEKNNNKDKEIYEKIEYLENLINEIKENKKEINNNDILKKVNNLITKNYEEKFKEFEDDIKNYDKNIEKLQKRIIKLENKTKISNDIKQENKTKKEINNEEDITNIYTNEELINQNKNMNINSSANTKRKRNSQRNSQRNSFNTNNSEEEEQKSKNYRIIKHKEEKKPDEKKYISQTYNKLSVITSHSVNRFTIKKQNQLDKNDMDYETFTRPRSKSKDHKRNRDKELENLSDNQLSKSIKYKDVNPPIPKEYENSITDSRIVEYDDFVFVENRIKEIYPKLNIELNLVYRASEDGDKSKDFHKKCDKIGPNVTLIKTKKGYVFGGFTAKNWEHLKRDININKPNLGSASRDMRAFGFCVNIQKIYNNEKPDEFAIWCNRNYGPTFKNNFFQIFDNCFKKGGYCSLRKNSHFGGQEYDYEISGGESKFGVDEIEVYEVIFT